MINKILRNYTIVITVLSIIILSGLSVSAGGDKPVSVSGAFPRAGGVPLLVHLFDDGSYDPDGEIVKWEWNFVDQEEGQGGWHDYTNTKGDAWHTYDHPGTKVPLLRVTDNDSNKDVAGIQIEIRLDGNANPVAMASASPTTGVAPLLVLFSAAGSYDPDGSITKYEWDFGDGIFVPDNDGEAQYIYTETGIYTAVLRVTDDDGASSTASVSIEISGGWQPGQRLTFSGSSSNPRLAVDMLDRIHVVWEDRRSGNSEIYYKWSDDGIMWMPDIRLTYNGALSVQPIIASYGSSSLYIFWVDNRDGNYEIYFKRSDERGLTWGQDVRLTSDSYSSGSPAVVVDNLGYIHLAWEDNRPSEPGGLLYWQIYYRRSTDGGSSWSGDRRVSDNIAIHNNEPDVSSSGDIVHIVWAGSPPRDSGSIFYNRSLNRGNHWEGEIRLTYDPNYSYYAGITTDEQGMVTIVWNDDRFDTHNYEILYKQSLDYGTSWGPDQRLTDNPFSQSQPRINASNGTIMVIWLDNRDHANGSGRPEIYFKKFSSGQWSEDLRLTYTIYGSYEPDIAAGQVGKIYVAWNAWADLSHLEIYFKRYLP